jgi:hypothetical protein
MMIGINDVNFRKIKPAEFRFCTYRGQICKLNRLELNSIPINCIRTAINSVTSIHLCFWQVNQQKKMQVVSE